MTRSTCGKPANSGEPRNRTSSPGFGDPDVSVTPVPPICYRASYPALTRWVAKGHRSGAQDDIGVRCPSRSGSSSSNTVNSSWYASHSQTTAACQCRIARASRSWRRSSDRSADTRLSLPPTPRPPPAAASTRRGRSRRRASRSGAPATGIPCLRRFQTTPCRRHSTPMRSRPIGLLRGNRGPRGVRSGPRTSRPRRRPAPGETGWPRSPRLASSTGWCRATQPTRAVRKTAARPPPRSRRPRVNDGSAVLDLAI